MSEEPKEAGRAHVRENGLVIRLLEELRKREAEKSEPRYEQRGGINVHYYLSPKIGSRMVGITSGIHQPGQGFEPHVHPLSEELLIVLRGKGEIFLKDRWIKVSEGDIVYAPEGVPHGTRNLEGSDEELITIGIAVPPQLDLYFRSGYYSIEGLDRPFGYDRLNDPPAED